MGMSWEKVLCTCINLFCPPLAVMFVAGVGPDVLINTLLFIAGVLPAHIHGFYVTWTYFWRKRKVSKGRYPGGRKTGIYSQRVWNGDASNQHVRELWKAEQRRKDAELMRKRKSQRGSWRY